MKPQIDSLHCLLWGLITWVNQFKDPKVYIEGVRHDCVMGKTISHELCFVNEHTGFMYNFDLKDKKALRDLNTICCLWANKGIREKTDYDGQNIFDIDDLTTLATG